MTHGTPAPERPACVICTSTLWTTERGRYACRLCERRIAGHLDDLPALVRDLHALRIPGTNGRRTAVRSSGKPESPAPVRLHILDLIDLTKATLVGWLSDWHDLLGWAAPTYWSDPLTEAATALRRNLPWAVESHAAVDEFAREIHDLHRDVIGLVNPATRARPVGKCPTVKEGGPCGATLRYAPGALSIRCAWCGTLWDALDLSTAFRATDEG
ncbi:zinc finger domain-containing protein [Streptomyces luteireticuli]|uniref:Zinc finger LSD1-type domain-containing protein n=1 Tax=Streptomyces luteireticuli TaxID=173858 RepID=A0ABP3ITA9_9ACTN